MMQVDASVFIIIIQLCCSFVCWLLYNFKHVQFAYVPDLLCIKMITILLSIRSVARTLIAQ